MKDLEPSETRNSTAAQAAHTPGPWRADIPEPVHKGHYAAGQCVEIARMLPGIGWPVATVSVFTDNWKANVRLIAAAPDMLAALKRAVARSDRNLFKFNGRSPECQADYDACVAAIAKAEGK